MARICAEKGQRAFIGKVCMDQNSPDYYVESFKECKHSTRQVVDYIKKELKDEKIQPVLTPRFAPSCSGADVVVGPAGARRRSECSDSSV